MYLDDDFLVSGDDLVGAGAGAAQVVDAFQEDDVGEAAAGQDVAGQAVQGTGAAQRRVGEDFVAGDAFVETDLAGTPVRARSRSDRRSGQRWLLLPLEWAPSVMESPSATIVPGAPPPWTVTASRKGQLLIVWVNEAAPVSVLWSPVPIRGCHPIGYCCTWRSFATSR